MAMRLVLTGLVLTMSVTGCAAFDSSEAPDHIQLTDLQVADDATADIRYPALLSYEARGDVRVIDTCFLWYDKNADFTSFRSPLWLGEGPYCFALEGDAGPEAIRSMLVTGYAGTYTVEGYVRYVGGGVKRRSNLVATEVTVRPRY